MKDQYTRVLVLDDEEGGQLYATWSRSRKRLILTVNRRGTSAQVELRPDQIAVLGQFLTAE